MAGSSRMPLSTKWYFPHSAAQWTRDTVWQNTVQYCQYHTRLFLSAHITLYVTFHVLVWSCPKLDS